MGVSTYGGGFYISGFFGVSTLGGDFYTTGFFGFSTFGGGFLTSGNFLGISTLGAFLTSTGLTGVTSFGGEYARTLLTGFGVGYLTGVTFLSGKGCGNICSIFIFLTVCGSSFFGGDITSSLDLALRG